MNTSVASFSRFWCWVQVYHTQISGKLSLERGGSRLTECSRCVVYSTLAVIIKKNVFRSCGLLVINFFLLSVPGISVSYTNIWKIVFGGVTSGLTEYSRFMVYERVITNKIIWLVMILELIELTQNVGYHIFLKPPPIFFFMFMEKGDVMDMLQFSNS
uniref:Uncharacterized protein n=1 Tax=Nelumbo nucifera TaxID=4432 RepID=A0A822YFK2_NELNU|nr:TPA_asm: hypothetical protein HUJ06_010053 [Nelumbo nucifera]